MIGLLIALVLALGALLVPDGALAATRFAKASGGLTSGTCTTIPNACTVQFALTVLSCGDTLQLQNGTYTASAAMLDVRASLGKTSAPTCTLGNEVTVQAETAGSVLIQGDSSLTPLFVDGLTYWIFQDLNFCCGFGTVWVEGTNHVTVRRVVAWDVTFTVSNLQVAMFKDNADGLIEDSAFFGLAEEVMLDFGASSNMTYRRLWLRNEGSDVGSASVAVQYNYTSANHANPSLFENIIQSSVPPRQGSIQYTTNLARHDAQSPYIRAYGGIHYLIGAVTPTAGPAIVLNSTPAPGCTGWIFQDQLVYANGRNVKPLRLPAMTPNGCDTGGSSFHGELTRVTAIRGGANTSDVGDATLTNVSETTSVGASGFDYIGSSNTARLCFRTVDGAITSTPLWPWPMDDRIAAAIAANSGNGSVALTGSSGTGYAAGTVTSEIVDMFGSIPNACNSAVSGGFTPNFPVASDFPATPVVDTFDRSDSGTLGSGWTNLNIGGTFSVVSNQAAAPAGFDRTYYTTSQFTANHEVYGQWTTASPCCGANAILVFAATDTASSNSQYRVLINRQVSSNATMEVRKIDSGGNSTTIISPVDLGADVADNEGFGVRVSGTTITIYWKYTDGVWYRIGEATSASLPTSNVNGGISGLAPAVVNDFGGGPTPTDPPISPPNPSPSSGAGRFGTTFPGVR